LIYQENSDGSVSNVYNIKILNKTHNPMNLDIKLLSNPEGIIKMAGSSIRVEDQGLFESTFVLFLPEKSVISDDMIVKFGIYKDKQLVETTESTFVGPINNVAK
jgi:hypothetical protein